MRLSRTTQPTLDLVPGSSYILRCGWPGWFQRDACAVWDLLRFAGQAPVGVKLLSAGDRGPDLVPHLELIDNGAIEESSLTLRTSGTTGVPKEVRRPLAKTIPAERIISLDQRWLLTYAPFRWAGISVMLHALAFDVELAVPSSLETSDIVKTAIEESATHVSLTPSLLRKLAVTVGKKSLSAIGFTQVTFGGEAVSQSVLDLAHTIWPQARLSHVYATTEFGDVCSVSDGIAGVPRHKLERPGFEFSNDGELLIRGIPSGDLWILKDGRYHFVARREDIINVGGAKVSPLEVENAVLGLGGVEEARAYAVPSPLVGQVVGLDYCGTPRVAEVKSHLRRMLPKVAWPAMINRVERIELTSASKLPGRQVQI